MTWRPLAVDLLVAALAAALGVLVANDTPVTGEREAGAIAFALIVVHSASILVRRRWPWLALLVGFGTALAYAAADYPVALPPVVLLSVYTAGAVLPPRSGRIALVASVFAAWMATSAAPGPTNASAPLLVVAAWLLGSRVERRRAYTAQLEEKNRLLEAAQLDLADQAVTEERLRIARELHDVVAHTMSVVAVHAGTGRMIAERDPAAARAALATIETSTRAALVEMRRLLGVLRGADGATTDALAPAPGLRDLDALVAGVVRSGVVVDVRVEGDRGELAAGVDLTAYRIVQEALTNVIKHAGRARASVVVRYEPDAVAVEIENDDGERLPAMAATGGRHGLVGMRERVAMYGGELEVGPRPGGYRVAARLPRTEAS